MPEPTATQTTSRLVENLLAVLGGLVLAFTAGAEAWAIINGTATSFHIPWANVLVGLALVLPKTLGRATAGKLWTKISDKVTK